MRILVLVKQVPDPGRIEFDPSTGRIRRENVPLQMNSFDRKAVEEAIRSKEKFGSEVLVATMGPPSAAEVLNQSLRMGADDAFLITDRRFVGSDTLVTSMILSSLVKKLGPDLVFAGKYSLDGETSQVPPEVARLSGYDFRSAVSSITYSDDMKSITVECEREYGMEKHVLKLPALISLSEKINKARIVKPSVPQMLDRIKTLAYEDLSVEITGADSPTQVEGTRLIDSTRKVEIFDKPDDLYRLILDTVRSKSGKSPEIQEIDPYVPERRWCIAVAFNDQDISLEIAAKVAEISRGQFNIRVIGNIDPGKLEGISCHEYVYVNLRSPTSFAEFLENEINLCTPEFVIFPSTIAGRDIASFIAADRHLGLTADCIDITYENGRLIQYKPAFGGGVVARIVSRTIPAMSTVRKGMFPLRKSRIRCNIVHKNWPEDSNIPLDIQETPEEYLSLYSSRIVISVGKGIESQENLATIKDLAHAMGAALGATRPIVDFGWIPRQQQIGLTGSSISPDLYIALGIAGHDNHMVGVRYARKIIAVNIDAKAPIFRYSDYGIYMKSMDFARGLSEFFRENNVTDKNQAKSIP
ncbi:MAG: FAD-binding protein [Thermoplasmataceae archaeon]|jgi:electron transfer flavoprotein alpha subunit